MKNFNQKVAFRSATILFFGALLSMFTFVSCDKNEDEKPSSVLEQEYFSIQNATVHQGAIPQLTSGSSIGSVTINRNVLPGGSSFVSINSAETISEIYVSVEGVNEYYSLTSLSAQAITRASAQSQAASTFVILFSQNLSISFTIQISALLSNGTLTTLYTAPLHFVNAGTGALQVSLSFDNDKDVDLYVVEPSGQVIYYGNRGGDLEYDEETGEYYRTWGLDIDSNPSCSIDGINNENVYYSTENIQSGKYEVWVNMYENCDASIATNWIIRATKEGALVPVTLGQNPASGVFPIGTPSNSIGASLNGALKVMEFNMQGTAQSTSAVMQSSTVIDPSAVMKLNKAAGR
ncbi:MAG: hypothetical protein LBQ28_03285 [Prevotellaceae bacterium]|jgi:hypothetical protein|nr:hypothetical protein [Prevotellaceae bacterium]